MSDWTVLVLQALKDKDGGAPIDEELYGSGAPPGYRDWDDGVF